MDRRYNRPIKDIISKEKLEIEYLNNNKSSEVISKEYNTSPSSILRRIKLFNIPLRSASNRQKLNIKLRGHPRLGIKLSEETKDRISKSHKGKKWSIDSREQMSLNRKGKYHNAEWNKKVSQALKGRIISEETKKSIRKAKENIIGKSYEEIYGKEKAQEIKDKISDKTRLENNPAWQGGKSFEPYNKYFNKAFKEAINIRDNDSCMICGSNNKLAVHHIDYNKLNSTKENCCCLCSICHSQTNFNRQHWTKFFQSLLNEKYGYIYNKIELNGITAKLTL